MAPAREQAALPGMGIPMLRGVAVGWGGFLGVLAPRPSPVALGGHLL